jgi:hypothetical protein
MCISHKSVFTRCVVSGIGTTNLLLLPLLPRTSSQASQAKANVLTTTYSSRAKTDFLTTTHSSYAETNFSTLTLARHAETNILTITDSSHAERIFLTMTHSSHVETNSSTKKIQPYKNSLFDRNTVVVLTF